MLAYEQRQDKGIKHYVLTNWRIVRDIIAIEGGDENG
jgi:hypothetical protein